MRLSVLLRVDAGTDIGYGHLMRTAALASALRDAGADVEVLLSGDAWSARMLSQLRVRWARSSADAERAWTSRWAARRARLARALVVDRPRISPPYVRSLRAAARADVVACFVDVQGTPGAVDVAMSGSAFWRARDWPPLPPATRRCSGPSFLCLRPQLAAVPRRRAVAPRVRRAVVTLGGADPLRLTVRATHALARALSTQSDVPCAIDVIVGPGFGEADAVASAAEALSMDGVVVRAIRAPRDAAPLMARADLAVAAGGSTLYELAYLGVPTVSLPETADESRNARAMARAGACVRVEPTSAWGDRLARAVTALDASRRRAMRLAGRDLIDGRGAERTAHVLARAAARIT